MSALLLPVLLGILVASLGVLQEPAAAIRQLNRYALLIAFPALILRGLLDPGFSWPAEPGPYLIPPVALALLLLPLGALLRRRPDARGVLALTTAFGNVAYLGLPLVVTLRGEAALGLASLLATEHVVLGLLVGPALLLHGRGDSPRAAVRALVAQPLLWAPIVAIPLRLLPGHELVREATAPIAASAAPVALFVLGLYLQQERRALGRWSAVAAVQVAAKLALLPAATWLVIAGMRAAGLTLSAEVEAIALLLSGMPSAITTFTLAASLDAAPTAVARVVVATTVLSPLTLWWLARAVG